ncbi:unnamed protein product [Dicrocoelium dendriticum]|nr:unnamed protein product [Dicrocoelium dendriticum]
MVRWNSSVPMLRICVSRDANISRVMRIFAARSRTTSLGHLTGATVNVPSVSSESIGADVLIDGNTQRQPRSTSSSWYACRLATCIMCAHGMRHCRLNLHPQAQPFPMTTRCIPMRSSSTSQQPTPSLTLRIRTRTLCRAYCRRA